MQYQKISLNIFAPQTTIRAACVHNGSNASTDAVFWAECHDGTLGQGSIECNTNGADASWACLSNGNTASTRQDCKNGTFAGRTCNLGINHSKPQCDNGMNP